MTDQWSRNIAYRVGLAAAAGAIGAAAAAVSPRTFPIWVLVPFALALIAGIAKSGSS